MSEGATAIVYQLRGVGGRKPGDAARESDPGPCQSPLPRIARLLALAIKLNDLFGEGVLQNNTHLARIGHVSPSRVTQVMNLMYLAPDIQEHLLFLPAAEAGRDAITEARIRKLAQQYDWDEQRRLFGELTRPRNTG